MLWFKGWLEMRWRLLFGLGMPAFVLFTAYRQGLHSPVEIARMLGGVSLLWVISAAMIAGTGIKTQPGSLGGMMKGLHGSTAFTLSLPVSRLRLLAVRTAMGLLGLLGITTMVTLGAWAIFPGLHATAADAMGHWAAGFTCALVFYCLSALMANVLDPTWQIYGSVFAAVVLRWLFGALSIPKPLDIFRATGDLSPLITHTLPLEAMGLSVAVSIVLFFTLVKIIQSSEY